MPFHKKIQNIIIGVILVLKEFRIISAEEAFKIRKKIILMTFVR